MIGKDENKYLKLIYSEYFKILRSLILSDCEKQNNRPWMEFN